MHRSERAGTGLNITFRCANPNRSVVSLALLILVSGASSLSREPAFSSYVFGGQILSKPTARRDGSGCSSKATHLLMVGSRGGSTGGASYSVFGHGRQSSYIALLTEPDACRDEARMAETVHAIKCAVETRNVDLVSIRATPSESDTNDLPGFQKKVSKLAEDIISVREELSLNFVLVINDNVAAAAASNADGVHVKEHDVDSIPFIRERLSDSSKKRSRWGDMDIVIGTSCHSVESGLNSWRKFRPDYLFVGTCFLTQSHPEKVSQAQLEGPSLPGKVKEAILEDIAAVNAQGSFHVHGQVPPVIFAIGGIDESNCAIPVLQYGCDGVAVIRSVLQAEEPGVVVQCMKDIISARSGENKF